jgi:hypothetical protein
MMSPLDAMNFAEDILDLIGQGGWDGKAATQTDIMHGLRHSPMYFRNKPKSGRRWSFGYSALWKALDRMIEAEMIVVIQDKNVRRFARPTEVTR